LRSARYTELALGSVQGLLAMRVRLSDAASSAVLAEHYSTQAEMCRQMARMTVSPFKEGWLEFAEEWTRLAWEQEAKAKPAESEMPANESFSEG
jgi:hypothetical protein